MFNIGKGSSRSQDIDNIEQLKSDPKHIQSNFFFHSKLSDMTPATILQLTQHHDTFTHNDTCSTVSTERIQ